MASGPAAANPAEGAFAVTPHDTNALTKTCRALYIGVSGNVKVTMERGDEVTFSNVPVGILPVQCTHVWLTGTTATTIVALY